MLFVRLDVQPSILARSYGGKPHLMASGDMLAYMDTSASLSSGRYNVRIILRPSLSEASPLARIISYPTEVCLYESCIR